MKKRVITIIALVLVLLGTSFVGYAYWDNLSQSQSETLTIGDGVTLTVSAVATAPVGKVLVPAGVVLKSNDVESIVLTYNVKLDQAAVSDLNLAVTSGNVQIGGSTVNADLVNINISQAASTVNGSDILITVTVTLTQPATQALYDAIKDQVITFDLSFVATQA